MCQRQSGEHGRPVGSSGTGTRHLYHYLHNVWTEAHASIISIDFWCAHLGHLPFLTCTPARLCSSHPPNATGVLPSDPSPCLPPPSTVLPPCPPGLSQPAAQSPPDVTWIPVLLSPADSRETPSSHFPLSPALSVCLLPFVGDARAIAGMSETLLFGEGPSRLARHSRRLCNGTRGLALLRSCGLC